MSTNSSTVRFILHTPKILPHTAINYILSPNLRELLPELTSGSCSRKLLPGVTQNMNTSKDQHDDLVRLSFFTEIGKSITSAKDLDAIFQKIMKHIGNIFAPANWSLFLKDPKTGDLCFRIVVGGNVENLQGTFIPRGKGIVGWIAEKGQPLIVEDVSKDSRFDHTIDTKTNFETKSIIGVPLLSNERVFGVIELINKVNGDNFTPFDLNLLRTIADFAAIAIEKNYYLQSLKRIAHIDSL